MFQTRLSSEKSQTQNLLVNDMRMEFTIINILEILTLMSCGLCNLSFTFSVSCFLFLELPECTNLRFNLINI